MRRMHKIGLDANRPIFVDGPNQGALAPTVADPEVIASTGAAWVRLNFVLGPWSGPNDQARHQGRTWAETYAMIVDRFRERGLNIYALVGHEIMKSSPDFFRVPGGEMSSQEVAQAQRWIDAYADNFLEVVKLFHPQVKFFESFNEPDDWHGQQRPWIHPTWFATMLQAIYRKLKLEMGIQDVVLISGPLQGLEINANVAPTTYLRQAYQYGKQEFDWGQPNRPYPFDGVGYHLYIKEGFNPDWELQEREVRETYRRYVDQMLGVIRQAEGAATFKQLYISEIGWPSNRDTQEEKEFQARNLSLALELLASDPAVALGIWFCTEDFDPGRKSYGLYQMGRVTPEGRKPAFAAYKAVTDRLREPEVAAAPGPQPALSAGTKHMKIGLALSGGGFRATVFHLGVLARLAEEKRLEDVTFLSTVSGGSLCIGLVYAINGFIWPSSADFIETVIPKARQLLTSQSLQHALIWRTLRAPLSIFNTRADDLSALLQKRWEITANLRDLPEHPRWMINATCYETGKNWRFERFRMGDYLFGYSNDTDIPLSDALAASAGFPGLIGPLELNTQTHFWFKYKDQPEIKESADPATHLQRKTEPTQPAYPKVHLWDGGVYDNLGLEGLHDFIEGWRADVGFLIVSDAAGKAKPEAYRRGARSLLRIVTGVMMPQILSLRSRAVLERMINHKDPGAFLQIGNTCGYILEQAGREGEIARLCGQCLPDEEVKWAAEMETHIRQLSQEEFERLYRHGFEVADCTLFAYHDVKFEHIGYGDSRWS